MSWGMHWRYCFAWSFFVAPLVGPWYFQNNKHCPTKATDTPLLQWGTAMGPLWQPRNPHPQGWRQGLPHTDRQGLGAVFSSFMFFNLISEPEQLFKASSFFFKTCIITWCYLLVFFVPVGLWSFWGQGTASPHPLSHSEWPIHGGLIHPCWKNIFTNHHMSISSLAFVYFFLKKNLSRLFYPQFLVIRYLLAEALMPANNILPPLCCIWPLGIDLKQDDHVKKQCTVTSEVLLCVQTIRSREEGRSTMSHFTAISIHPGRVNLRLQICQPASRLVIKFYFTWTRVMWPHWQVWGSPLFSQMLSITRSFPGFSGEHSISVFFPRIRVCFSNRKE